MTPYLGAWLPLGVVRDEIDQGQRVQRSQVGDIMAGGRAGVVFGHGFAAELSLGCSPGQVAKTDGSGTFDSPGLALLATARLTRLARLNSAFDGHFGAGVGVIRRSGAGWGQAFVAQALVAAFGIETNLTAGSAFRMEFELYGSRGQRVALGPDPPGKHWRGDLVVSFGIVLPSPRR